MLYSIKPKITYNLIKTYVSDYDIYSYYLGYRFEIGKVFNSPLREDKNPSFGIINNDDGALIWNDFATGDNGNAVTFVKSIKKLDSYKGALETIYEDLVVKGSRIPESTIKPLRTPKNSLKIDLGVQRQRWTKIDKEYWSSIGITSSILKKFNVNSIKYFFIGDYVKWIYEDTNPMYHYMVWNEDHTEFRRKIYRPLADKKEKLHSNITKDFIFGWNQLPKEGNLVIITKSLKDVMCLDGLGYIAISPPSEGTLLPDKKVNELKHRFKNIIILYDNDKAGREAAKRIADKFELKTVEIPEDSGEKDLTDYYKRYGRENTSILLKNILK